jgi:hypothetical protein
MLSVVTHRPSPSSWRRTQCGWQNGEHLNHSANPAWPVHAHADADIPTRWGRLVSADAMPLPEYPRPQLVRGHYAVGANATLLRDAGDPRRWANLNGLWEWEPATPGNSTAGTFGGYPPFDRPLNSSILVPFPVEACLSGRAPLSSNSLVKWMWYRLKFDAPARGERTLLHFGAVDWRASVYLNKRFLGNHTGGYSGFSFDVTEHLTDTGNVLLVGVFDPSDSGSQPQGKQKQGAISNPGWPPLNGSHITGNTNPAANWFATFGIVYTPSSGIWQTVWLESVPATYIQSIAINQASQTAVTINISATARATSCAAVVLDGGTEVASSPCRVGTPFSIPIRSPELWSPDHPHLYDLKISLTDGQADEVLSYFGMRTFELEPNPVIPETPVMQDTDLGPPVGCKCVPYAELPIGNPPLNGFGGPACNTTNPERWCYTKAGACPDGQPSQRIPGYDSSDTACLASNLQPCGLGGCSNLTTIVECKALCQVTSGCAGYTWQPGTGNGTANGTLAGNTMATKRLCWLKMGPFNVHPPFNNHTGRDSQVLARMGATYPILNSNRTFLVGTLDQVKAKNAACDVKCAHQTLIFGQVPD